MKKLITIICLLLSFKVSAETNFDGVLKAAESGDCVARVVVAYSYYIGEYRDGTKVEKNLDTAYAWASLAYFQGDPEAKRLVFDILPKLEDAEAANILAGEYFNKYGAKKNEGCRSN